jgi:hypothetical protein
MNTPLRGYEQRIFERINPAVRFSVTRYVLIVGFFAAVFFSSSANGSSHSQSVFNLSI